MMYGQCCGVRVCLYDHGVSVCCMFKESVMYGQCCGVRVCLCVFV